MKLMIYLLVILATTACKLETVDSSPSPDVEAQSDQTKKPKKEKKAKKTKAEEVAEVEAILAIEPDAPLVQVPEDYDGEVYMIVPYDEVTQAMIDVATQSRFDTLRHSLSGDDLVILSYVFDRPEELSYWDEYTHAQILIALQATEWQYVPNAADGNGF
jgi:hypothetical protein